MDKLNVSLINCFGIESLDHEFDLKRMEKSCQFTQEMVQ